MMLGTMRRTFGWPSGVSGSFLRVRSGRRQWTKRKEEHARLVAASSKVAALTKKRVYARGKPKPPVVHEAVLAGPPRDKRPLPLSQPAYELAMGKYAIATQLYLDRVTILI
jgi:hypothetical protein